MVVFESARFCGAHDHTVWPPGSQHSVNHSWFRVRSMDSGRVIGDVQGSECYAYGSAVVDPVLQRAWVFGSQRDLCGRGEGRSSSQACAATWGSSVAGNGVRAWWSDDLVHWQTAADPALLFDDFPFNTDVTAVVGKSMLPGSHRVTPGDGPLPLNFVLVSESGRVAAHAGPNRNLSFGWTHISNQSHGGGRGFGACPAVHYGEEDGFFYVLSGGRQIALSRSPDLRSWEQAPAALVPVPPLGSAAQREDTALSPFLGIARQARVGEGAATLKSVLAHPDCWLADVSDSDFCCGGPKTAPGAPEAAFLMYSVSSQGKPPKAACSGVRPRLAATNFNAIATANVSLTALLSSHF